VEGGVGLQNYVCKKKGTHPAAIEEFQDDIHDFFCFIN
jgi:hypothetical protein